MVIMEPEDDAEDKVKFKWVLVHATVYMYIHQYVHVHVHDMHACCNNTLRVVCAGTLISRVSC